MVVDADMDIFKADLAVLADAAAGDAVSRLVEAGEPLDVEMTSRPAAAARSAGPVPLPRGPRAGRGRGGPARPPPSSGRARAESDLGRGQPALPQPEDHPAPARAHPPGAAQRPRGAVDQAGSTFGPLAGTPFAHRVDADAEARGRRCGGPAILDAGDQKGSTVGVGPRILVDVHSGPSKEGRPRNPHSPYGLHTPKNIPTTPTNSLI